MDTFQRRNRAKTTPCHLEQAPYSMPDGNDADSVTVKVAQGALTSDDNNNNQVKSYEEKQIHRHGCGSRISAICRGPKRYCPGNCSSDHPHASRDGIQWQTGL